MTTTMITCTITGADGAPLVLKLSRAQHRGLFELVRRAEADKRADVPFRPAVHIKTVASLEALGLLTGARSRPTTRVVLEPLAFAAFEALFSPAVRFDVVRVHRGVVHGVVATGLNVAEADAFVLDPPVDALPGESFEVRRSDLADRPVLPAGEMDVQPMKDEFVRAMAGLREAAALPDVQGRRYACEPLAVRAAELWHEMSARGVEFR